MTVIIMLFACGCKDDHIECPDFTGKKYDVITAAEQYDMLNFEAVYEQSDKDDIGTVISQEIKTGEKIKRGSTVTLHVSLGLTKSGVPDVVGQNAELAKATVTLAGFGVSVIYSPNSDFEEGMCYATSPAAGEQFAVGQTVTVYISLGNEKKLIPYVSVVGLSYNDAVEKLSKVGLNVGRVTYEESEKPEGTVIGQLPAYAASIEIAEGSLVNITVAKSPEN